MTTLTKPRRPKAKPARKDARKPAVKKRAAAPKPYASRRGGKRLDWNGVVLSVAYDPNRTGMAEEYPQYPNAHLEIRVIAPEGAALPITDTGYRSHHLHESEIDAMGGPVAYVRAWLDQEAKSPAWKRHVEKSRQLCLF